jgi:hypothetical protein
MGGPLQTEFEFSLPNGYVGDDGSLHREGVMRLATAADEIQPLRDPRVRSNPSYLSVILLSRVVTRLGSLEDVTPAVIENLFVADLAHLQELYERVNTRGADTVDTVCPECGERFETDVGGDPTTAPVAPGPSWQDGDPGSDTDLDLSSLGGTDLGGDAGPEVSDMGG